MVGASADDTNADTVLLVPAGITVDDVDAVTGVEVVDSTLTVDLPDLRMRDVLVTRFFNAIDMVSHLLKKSADIRE